MREPHTSSDFRAYLDDVSALAGLADRLQGEVHEATVSGAAEVRRVQVEERSTRARLATAVERLDRLEGDLALLVPRAGVAEPTPDPGLHLGSVDEVETLLRGLTADVVAARRSWEWVERAQTREVREAHLNTSQAPGPAAAAADHSEDSLPQRTAGGGMSRRVVAISVAGSVLLLLLVIFIISKGV